MNTYNDQLTRHEFLKAAAAFAGLPLLVSAGEAAVPLTER